MQPKKGNPKINQPDICVLSGDKRSEHLLLESLGTRPVRIKLEKGAQLELVVSGTGKTAPETEVTVELGEGSRLEVIGVVLVRKGASVSVNFKLVHREPRSRANVTVRGAVENEAVFHFSGLIKIGPKAKQVQSFLTNNVLLLSANARATSLPSLEIETDAVKASHAATIGPLDEDQLFYLESRGVPAEKAERLIVEGFLGGLAEKISAKEIRENLRELVFAGPVS